MTRAVVLLLVLGLVAFGAAAVGVVAGVGTGPCGERRIEAASSTTGFDATFVGDTMLGDAAAPLLAAQGYDWAFAGLAGVLDDGFVMANAEGPITTLTEPFDTAQHWHYNAQPGSAAAIARVGIDAVSLANNHAMDRGPAGLADTTSTLTASGVAAVGAGPTMCEAELPLLVRTPAGTLGVVALGKYYGREKTASLAGAGTVAFSEASIIRGATLARSAGADWVVAFVHWGGNYGDVDAEQEDLAEAFAEAGYDLVVGAHPHVSQRIDVIDRMPVVYSMGNFVFGAPGRFAPERPGAGLVVKASFDQDGLAALTVRCVDTNNDTVAYQPRPCDAPMAATTFASLNPAMVVNGGVGTLAIP